MNFEASLSYDSSRAMIETIAKAIGTDKKLFEKVLTIAYTAKDMSASRAARVIDMNTEMNPELGDFYANNIAKNIINLDSRTKRSLCRVLTRHLPDDEEILGHFISFAFEQMLSPSEPVALKVYAMQALFNITVLIPELKNELIQSIEQQLPNASVGLKSRAKKLIKKLYKM